jgi:hypothetical protein
MDMMVEKIKTGCGGDIAGSMASQKVLSISKQRSEKKAKTLIDYFIKKEEVKVEEMQVIQNETVELDNLEVEDLLTIIQEEDNTNNLAMTTLMATNINEAEDINYDINLHTSKSKRNREEMENDNDFSLLNDDINKIEDYEKTPASKDGKRPYLAN